MHDDHAEPRDALLGAHPAPSDDGDTPQEGDVIRAGMPLDRSKHTLSVIHI